MITFACVYFLVPRLWQRRAAVFAADDQLALLARDAGDRVLRLQHVGCGHHARADVARIRV